MADRGLHLVEGGGEIHSSWDIWMDTSSRLLRNAKGEEQGQICVHKMSEVPNTCDKLSQGYVCRLHLGSA